MNNQTHFIDDQVDKLLELPFHILQITLSKLSFTELLQLFRRFSIFIGANTNIRNALIYFEAIRRQLQLTTNCTIYLDDSDDSPGITHDLFNSFFNSYANTDIIKTLHFEINFGSGSSSPLCRYNFEDLNNLQYLSLTFCRLECILLNTNKLLSLKLQLLQFNDSIQHIERLENLFTSMPLLQKLQIDDIPRFNVQIQILEFLKLISLTSVNPTDTTVKFLNVHATSLETLHCHHQNNDRLMNLLNDPALHLPNVTTLRIAIMSLIPSNYSDGSYLSINNKAMPNLRFLELGIHHEEQLLTNFTLFLNPQIKNIILKPIELNGEVLIADETGRLVPDKGATPFTASEPVILLLQHLNQTNPDLNVCIDMSNPMGFYDIFNN